ADNPTFHATIGWDWIPTVRGRNIGIWNDVKFVSKPDMVTIDDVFVTTDLPLPSTDYADIYASVQLTNHSSTAPSAGRINVDYGGLKWGKDFELAPNQSIELELDPAKLDNPKLWWPAGYGEPYLYDVEIQCVIDDIVVDLRKFKSGVRKMSYTTDNNILDLYINGRRLICNGGNWGYPEINLNYREREYDIAVAYHADMNFTMIRNWVGMTGDEEFFEACDRHGVMIWQDFWLANPWDGPDPDDEAIFCRNATDFVKRIRNHPAIALYVGRNEGYPPASLNSKLENIVNTCHPGIFYIPNSADDMVSGHGPYRALPVDEYFSTGEGRNTLHSERGMPNVMTAESMRMMLDEKDWWPQTSIWGIHDYTMENAQSCATFNSMVSNAFAEPSGLDEFTSWAQWINYNGYRAMFESRSWNRKGLLIWMSHSCWPSMVWQTYDYYFEPTAAYFGAKKGSAPIRIQWNPVSKNVEVVNNNASDMDGLTANVKVLTYNGKELYNGDAYLDSKEDSTTPIMLLSFDIEGITNTYIIKLTLKQGDRIVADNLYVESLDGKGQYKELLSLPKAALSVGKEMKLENGTWKVDITITNDSDIPAYMVRLKTIGSKSGERILPVFYQDNYFSLLPGEKKIVKIHFKQEDCRGECPDIGISGFNM
ncbi:MAG: beta-glycosidase, partial [Bacteroidales bacterium]|nr:beta-glycosidase [Bacteroidales bacterium]